MANVSDLKQTPLYNEHVNLKAKMVDFGGWALPVSYTSQVEEHHSVRKTAGMFDVSHMTVSDITGTDTLVYLSKLLANDIHKATNLAGKALYSCMLNEEGGVIDDLIAYYLNDQHCRLVTNAATNEKDMAWLQQQAQGFAVTIEEKPSLALIAVQGPEAIEKAKLALDENAAQTVAKLKRFQGSFAGEYFIGRTGYTGEDGLEIILPGAEAPALWQSLLSKGVQACGLGARDTLRLEAGMALYGNDLDEEHSPLESGLKWTVVMDDERQFIGKQALGAAPRFKMVGLKLDGKGVLRNHQKVLLNEQEIGETTSGGFSPSLNQSIALARIAHSAEAPLGSQVTVQVRQKLIPATIVKYPFL